MNSSTALSGPEKLEILRQHDRFRSWKSLDDERCCLVCSRIFNGHEIRIEKNRRDGAPTLLCPTRGCGSIAMDWVIPSDEKRAAAIHADQNAAVMSDRSSRSNLVARWVRGLRDKKQKAKAGRLKKM